MDKIKKWIQGHIPTRRRLVQLYAALLYNAHIKGFVTGNIYTGPIKNLCVPGLNCYSCPGALGACPLGALQNAIASAPVRTPVYVIGILMLYGLTLGRTICGWLCPVGLVQELMHKLPTRKIKKSTLTRKLSCLKYMILVFLVILVPAVYSLQKYPLPAFCKFICPAGIFEGAAGLLIHPDNRDLVSLLGPLFTWKCFLLVGIGFACIFVYRAFCRFLCPLGAIYSLFAKVAVIGIRVDPTSCTGCDRCVKCCPMDIRHPGDRECIHCGKCVEVCPTEAITLNAGKVKLVKKGTGTLAHGKRKMLPAMAAVLMIGLLFFVNLGAEGQSAPDYGWEVGMTAPDFTVPLYGEAGGFFRLEDHRGKTVVVNFWATWCGPCCEELPYFDALYQNYGSRVEVIAIHSNLVTEDVPLYLDGYNYAFAFGLDETGAVLESFHGGTMLPQTVVIDPEGIIVYNEVGSVTYETLVQILPEGS